MAVRLAFSPYDYWLMGSCNWMHKSFGITCIPEADCCYTRVIYRLIKLTQWMFYQLMFYIDTKQVILETFLPASLSASSTKERLVVMKWLRGLSDRRWGRGCVVARWRQHSVTPAPSSARRSSLSAPQSTSSPASASASSHELASHVAAHTMANTTGGHQGPKTHNKEVPDTIGV